MAIDDRMSAITLARAKLHVYNVCATGGRITLVRPGTKDEFGSLLTEVTQELKAFPIRHNPYDRKTIEKISWAEETDIICFVPKLQLDNLSLTITQIQKLYKTFRHNNKTYNAKYIEPYSPFYDDFLYMIVGGKS
jgi:hypothetical protein